ncbi:MAG: YihY/virulence factor BrkB family protein [Anaerolineae bacterium]|nr:YihY/virulence factor BrkB family protein [Anaerolineae bacterium]
MSNYTSTENLKIKFKTGYQQANDLSRGTLAILVHTYHTFGQANAAEAAASIAYYALFSLFPLLLFLVTLASSVLESDQVAQQIVEITATALPPAKELVAQNIKEILARRGAMGTVAVIGLLWAASSVFTILTRNINKAWHSARPHNFLLRRLMGLTMVAILAGLLMLSLISTTIFRLLPHIDMTGPLWGEVLLYETYSWALASRLVPWFFMFVMCLGLYRWIPNTKVGWLEAIVGALVAATAGETTKSIFTWYLGSGLARYDLVYGSLATPVVLMLSIYFGSLVLLFGAHLSAAIGHHRHKKRPTTNDQ